MDATNYPAAELFLLWANTDIPHIKLIDKWFPGRKEEEFFRSMATFFVSLDAKDQQRFVDMYNERYKDTSKWKITLDGVLQDIHQFVKFDLIVQTKGLQHALELIFGEENMLVEHFLNKMGHIKLNYSLALYTRMDPCNKSHFISSHDLKKTIL